MATPLGLDATGLRLAFGRGLLLAASLSALWLVRWLLHEWTVFRRNLAAVAHVPSHRVLVHPHHLAAMALPRRIGFNLGEQYSWRYKHDFFRRGEGVDVVALVAAVPQIRSFVVADADAVRYIMAERRRFVKPVHNYAALSLFGPNVGVTEGAEWLRHRRIVAGPTFADSVNASAWTETARTLDLCFDDWTATFGAHGEVRVDSMVTLTLKLALFVRRPGLTGADVLGRLRRGVQSASAVAR